MNLRDKTEKMQTPEFSCMWSPEKAYARAVEDTTLVAEEYTADLQKKLTEVEAQRDELKRAGQEYIDALKARAEATEQLVTALEAKLVELAEAGRYAEKQLEGLGSDGFASGLTELLADIKEGE